jgi:hypothetical protein
MVYGVVFGITAGRIHFTAYFFYHRGILKGSSKPNNTSWTLWALLGLLNSTSYVSMSHDVVKTFFPQPVRFFAA